MSAIVIRAIDHVVLRVSDLSRSVRFYCDVLGCTEERRIDEAGLVQLRAGAGLIDLIDATGPLGQLHGPGGPPAAGAARNMDHFALFLAEFDAFAIRARLREHGIDAGEVEERYGARGMGPSMYIRDPDGNVVELKGPATAK